ncbi:hypothetical protein REC12_20025 [Desulfosporosinus sp. PR]|uniref:hypothetical protein n=1 Tax=Candidatus Desulfosporosinus nitrosoreducens TaxID=3401928 RepID=UPI0027FA0170|nr:hypothetical protein [Desulfosporosinus sp. PR]MDQ7095886.1 hypothetical protein [Desulfosporosinus sp. PR]
MAHSPLNNLKENEGIAALVFLIFCTALALKFTPNVGTSNLAPAVSRAAAPWIFGPFQVLLLYLPPRLGVIAIPTLIVAGLAGLPWFAKHLGDAWGKGIFSVLWGFVLILLLWYAATELWWV